MIKIIYCTTFDKYLWDKVDKGTHIIINYGTTMRLKKQFERSLQLSNQWYANHNCASTSFTRLIIFGGCIKCNTLTCLYQSFTSIVCVICLSCSFPLLQLGNIKGIFMFILGAIKLIKLLKLIQMHT
jgi:hypothetical protein